MFRNPLFKHRYKADLEAPHPLPGELFLVFNIHTTQSGFRPNHSCETALVGMIDKWLKAINENSLVGVGFFLSS